MHLEVSFASNVALRWLDGSVAKEKLKLFQFASTCVAQTRASAAEVRVVRGLWRLSDAQLHRVPDYVGCHPSTPWGRMVVIWDLDSGRLTGVNASKILSGRLLPRASTRLQGTRAVWCTFWILRSPPQHETKVLSRYRRHIARWNNGPEVLGLYLERPARRSSWIEGVLWALRIQRLEGSRPAREPMGFVCG